MEAELKALKNSAIEETKNLNSQLKAAEKRKSELEEIVKTVKVKAAAAVKAAREAVTKAQSASKGASDGNIADLQKKLEDAEKLAESQKERALKFRSAAIKWKNLYEKK
eukprot:g3402.t1